MKITNPSLFGLLNNLANVNTIKKKQTIKNNKAKLKKKKHELLKKKKKQPRKFR